MFLNTLQAYSLPKNVAFSGNSWL